MKNERARTGGIIMTTVKHIGGLLNRMYTYNKCYYLLSLVQALMSAVMTLIPIVFIKYLISALEQHQYQFASILVIVFLVGEYLGHVIIRFIGIKQRRYEEELQTSFKIELANKQMSMRYEKLQKTEVRKSYRFAQQAISEGSLARIIEIMIQLVSNTLVFLGIIYVFTYMNFWMFMVIVAVVVINIVGEIKRMNSRYQEVYEESSIETNLYYARDYLTTRKFAKEVRIYDFQAFIIGKIEYFIEEVFKLKYATVRKYLATYRWCYIANGIQLFVIYIYSSYLFFSGVIDISEYSMCTSALLVFGNTLFSFIQSITSLRDTGRYISHYNEFMTQSNEVNECGMTTQDIKTVEIEFRNVSFRYSEDTDYILKDINLTIRYGEKLALIGLNGAGKTTFVKLLLGLYKPTSGEIYINGREIESYSYQEYLNLYSTVFQDFKLFEFTIAENVTMGNAEREKDIEQLLQAVNLEGKIGLLEEGADTYLMERMGENGTNMSGGEKQKLAFARALYKNSLVYILDEPTSALSPQSEYVFYKNFDQLIGGHTVIYISHRLASCKLCDRIVVLNNGEIGEEGTHDVLSKCNGLYSEMFSKQASFYQTIWESL